MLHDHFQFRRIFSTPPSMDYVLKFYDQPIFITRNWMELHQYALNQGFALNVLGCIFTLLPGVTIQHPVAY